MDPKQVEQRFWPPISTTSRWPVGLMLTAIEDAEESVEGIQAAAGRLLHAGVAITRKVARARRGGVPGRVTRRA